MLPLPLISTIACLDYISFFMLAFHQPNVASVHFISLRQLFCTTAIFLSITPFCSFCLFYSDHFQTFDLFCSFILSFRSVRFTHRFHHHCVHNFDQFLFKSILSPADSPRHQSSKSRSWRQDWPQVSKSAGLSVPSTCAD